MGIKVYIPQEMKKDYPQNEAIGLEKMKRITDGDFSITPFQVPHNQTDCYAYIIRVDGHRIAWLTDLEYCPYILKNQRLTDILCECNYQNDLVNKDLPQYSHKLLGHMSLKSCVGFIEANKTSALRTVLLLHMGAETCEPMECVAEVQKVVPMANVDYARKGFEIELSEFPF